MGAPETVVEVLPDLAGLDRTFHYLVPARLGDMHVGTIVRVALQGRRTRGWVVAAVPALRAVPAVPAGVELKAIEEIVSLGPPPEVVDLCRWAAWRYAGRLRPLLLAGSAPKIVRALEPPNRGSPPADATHGRTNRRVPAAPGLRSALEQVLAKGEAVLRLPPTMPRLEAVAGLLELRGAAGTGVGLPDNGDRTGDPLILVESRSDAVTLSARLRAIGHPVSLHPEDWAAAAAGGRVVVGTRNAAFAPVTPSMIIVLDAHSESYRSERIPTFDARVVVAERARVERIPVCFVSPCPSLELLAGRPLVLLERSAERNGWGAVAVLDAREEDPREGGYPARLVTMVRTALADHPGERVLLVLNRTGRVRLLACGSCRTMKRCPDCGAALAQPVRPPTGEIGELVCPRCHLRAAAICPACGSARHRILRRGVGRAREDLAGLLGMDDDDVGVVAGPRAALPDSRVVVGTESVLHRVPSASMVGFLDFDHELLAPRFRAAEQALVLLARAVRIAGARGGPGRVVIRTSMPDHEVIRAAQHGDPAILAAAEGPRREALRLPPASALAIVSGAGARAVADRLAGTGVPLEVAPFGDGPFLVRARGAEALAEGFAALRAEEAAGWAGLDARVEVDPVDV